MDVGSPGGHRTTKEDNNGNLDSLMEPENILKDNLNIKCYKFQVGFF